MIQWWHIVAALPVGVCAGMSALYACAYAIGRGFFRGKFAEIERYVARSGTNPYTGDVEQ